MDVTVLPIGLPPHLRERLDTLPKRVKVLTGTPEDAVAEASVLLYWASDKQLGSDLIAAGKRLKWVHVPWVGVEYLLVPKVRQGDVLLTNSRGVAGSAVAEYVLGAVLAVSKNLPRHIQDSGSRTPHFQPSHEVRGRTMLVVGLGDIGKAVARYAKNVGMRVRAVTTRPAPYWACESVKSVADLNGELPLADYVVLSLPATPQTNKLINEVTLRQMRSTSWLINVARGEVVDEAALAAALKDGVIGGAVLDVTEKEPLPSDSFLWDAPNIVLTPHVASWTEDRFERAYQLFERNLNLWMRGEQLQNVVPVERGY
jgi:phosphoglycerate dehydrogenase-like enzyme